MEEKELSIELRNMACSQPTPLCKEWTEAWEDDSDIDTLLEKYIKGFDFAVKNDFPPLDFSRKNFNKDDLHRHNIYIDDEVNINNAESGYYVFLGNSRVILRVDGLKAVTVYVRHDSEVNVHATGGARVFVTYYDKSSGNCYQDDWSKCKRYERKRVAD